MEGMLEHGGWTHETNLERAGKRQTVYNIIHHLHSINVTNLINEAKRENIDWHELKGILTELRQKGLIYSPRAGVVVCVDDRVT
jgi:hypothetical protein